MPYARPRPPRPRVVVAGGGVGAVEAALAIRELLGSLVDVDLAAPADALTYRPLTVAEPFGFASVRELPFARLAETHGIRHVRGALDQVDAHRGRLRLVRQGWSGFDALVVATGARLRRWLPDALTFGGSNDVDAYRSLLEALHRRQVERLLFVAPAGPSWPLPVYELALLTAAWLADHEVDGVELHLATPEDEPLAVFGPAAAHAVRDLLGDRGIALHAGHGVVAMADGRVTFEHGAALAADRIVTLPALAGNPVRGLAHDAAGFIPVSPEGAVEGAQGVWAVGDVTARPIKMGGLATQQADAAASAVARFLGASAPPPQPAPELRAILLTGVASAFLRARLDGAQDDTTVAFGPRWMPPAKVAGRHLAPYLARHATVLATPVIAERAHVAPSALDEPSEVRRLALALALEDEARGDRASARQWRETVEWLDGRVSSSPIPE